MAGSNTSGDFPEIAAFVNEHRDVVEEFTGSDKATAELVGGLAAVSDDECVNRRRER